jgi:glycosyltransferase involved in cell wall biosynthesis
VRILVANKYAHVTGGADRYCLELTALLREAGHDVRWLSTASPANAEHEGAFVAPRPAAALWNRAAAAAAARELRGFRPDVVHCHKLYPHLSVAPVVLAARAGVPVVQTAHDYELCSPARSGGLHKRSAEALLFPVKRRVHVPRVARFVAPSEHVAAALHASRIEAAVVEHFVRAQVDVSGFDARAGVLFAGRLVPEKGLDDVLRLARELPDLDVAVAGAGPLEGRVRTAARIRYVGPLEPGAVVAALGRARVVVVPSRWAEPAGLVALEAMSAGTPVAAYAVGGLAEYVDAAVTGFDALRDAVRTLHDDRAAWERRSAAALEAVRTRFTPERHLAGLEAVYRSAAGDR